MKTREREREGRGEGFIYEKGNGEAMASTVTRSAKWSKIRVIVGRCTKGAF